MPKAIATPRYLVADKAYDADALRSFLVERGGTRPVIPNKDDRKFLHPFSGKRYKSRNSIKHVFCRLKDCRRVATRYDKLARNYLASLCLAAIVSVWIRRIWNLARIMNLINANGSLMRSVSLFGQSYDTVRVAPPIDDFDFEPRVGDKSSKVGWTITDPNDLDVHIFISPRL